MFRHSLPLLALLTALAGTPMAATPAAAAAPVCIPGFQTIQKTNWLLRCRKTVPIAQMGVAITEANNALCTTERYWNFGPKVETQVNRLRGTATIDYLCGHVEG